MVSQLSSPRHGLQASRLDVLHHSRRVYQRAYRAVSHLRSHQGCQVHHQLESHRHSLHVCLVESRLHFQQVGQVLCFLSRGYTNAMRIVNIVAPHPQPYGGLMSFVLFTQGLAVLSRTYLPMTARRSVWMIVQMFFALHFLNYLKGALALV